ncbi:UrcA family protein [Phenylobacterium sp.]|uniref:UrcA family protein n=1 Tax=Phenylobacterium sp. TaxID=1871053 RepID=UPI003562DEDB
MSHFTTRIAGLAALALGVTLAAAAHAQPTVQISDLNLASAAGQAAFAHRTDVAADQVCGDERNLSIQFACKAAVRAEVTEKLAAIAPTTQFAASSHARSSVRIADLNLASAAGKAAFAHRLNVAASQVCGDERDLTIQHACRVAIRTEVTEKLAMITPATQLAQR